ncbi:unnamed protein product [Darwinula stevensoni]|uniref:Uncharacterized protein n=1 Tax=Darwinula stevensoni TaxID=69355 RepID=A0A7R9A1Z7_9CRUS|nr:unnamed protein product [Darwinula stevensoni]CAG0888721.1 unnamed protein product [Darwinula stevensoni]
MKQFHMKGNKMLEDLHEGVFAGLSFQWIFVEDTNVRTIHPSALLHSMEVIMDLTIGDSGLEEFPFQLLPKFRRLKGLSLYGNLLTSVPALQTDTLEMLDLSMNNISRLEGNEWATPSLKNFNLSSNSLSSVPALKIDSLEILDLSRNEITRLEVNRLAMPKLMILDLSRNSLASVPAMKMQSLERLNLSLNIWLNRVEEDGWATPNLKSIDLSGNSLTSVPILKIDSLEKLDVGSNDINLWEKNGWGAPRLKNLCLSWNSLTQVPALKMDSLEILDLGFNKITRLEENGWSTPNLKSLYISYNPLAMLPSAVIKDLKKLEVFSCEKCNLGPTLPCGFLEFRSNALKTVSLILSGISILEPGAITGLKADTGVYLDNNNITTLDERIFRSILGVILPGDGILSLNGEPLLKKPHIYPHEVS